MIVAFHSNQLINLKIKAMKKVLYLAVVLISLSATATTPPEISEKVIKAFNETFTEAEEVSWRELEDCYQANFKVSEIRVKATYDTDGNLLRTIKCYQEKNLPSNILAKLKIKHAGKKITGVTEIVTDNDISYHIVLRDENHWYWVDATPYAALSLTQKLKRGEPRSSGF
jgi:hypothetical protein